MTPDAGSARQALRGVALTVLAMGLGVWAVAQSDVGAEAIADLARQARPLPLAAALLAMSSGMLFLALRWRALMPAEVRARVAVLPLAGILFVGTLLNYALPGPAGEFVAAAIAGRRFGMPSEVALAASMHGRFIGLAMAGVVAGALYIAAEMPVPPDLRPWIGMATLGVTALSLSLAWFSARPGLLRRVADATTGRFAWLERVHAPVARLADALGGGGSLGAEAWARAAGWALAGHALVIVGTGLAAVAFGGVPDPAGLAFTYAMATAGAIVLFAFPGSQVGWDASFTSLLVTTAGLSLPQALATAMVVRVQQLVVVAIGAVALLRGAIPPTDGAARAEG